MNYIRSQFPDTKIEIIYGNSVETIAKYISENPEQLSSYDLCHLDGGHTQDIFSHDYANVKKLMKAGGMVIFDDYDLPAIRSFITAKLAAKEITQVVDGLVKTDLHFIYRYTS